MAAQFPLPVILVGEQPALRWEFSDQHVVVEHEYRTLKDVLNDSASLKDSTHLIMSQVNGPDYFRELKRLGAALVGQPQLVFLPAGKDADAILTAMRAGASQVVPLPLDVADFRAALERIAVQFGGGVANSRRIAVSGVTGGAGATTLASNLAFELAHMHSRRVILAEMNPQIGMLETYLEVSPRYTLADLVTTTSGLDRKLVAAALTPFSDTLSVLVGPKRPIASVPELYAKLQEIVTHLQELADIVVLDVPCTFDDSYFDMLAESDHVILVAEQRIPSVRNVQLVLSSLPPSRRSKCHVVLNRYDPKLTMFTCRDLEKLLDTHGILTMSNDPAGLTAALHRGQPLRLGAPNSPVLSDVERLVRVVFDAPTAAPGKANRKTMVGRLIQACGLS